MSTQPLDDRDVAPWDEGEDPSELDEQAKEREAERIDMHFAPSEGIPY